MVLHVDNRNREHSRFCTAADGEHVQVGPGAKNAPIADKFGWKLDPDVVFSRNSVRTFKTAEQEAADQEAADARKKAEEAALEQKHLSESEYSEHDGETEIPPNDSKSENSPH